MNSKELFEQIKKKKSFLCVGLDPDPAKIPSHLSDSFEDLLSFNKQIIDATSDHAVAYKPNTAFFEALGSKGWDLLQATAEYLPKECFLIADAKRGDIGNTSNMYARAFFEQMPFDAVTVAPYMGEDSVSPFLQHKNKWAIVLALTSNQGAFDFQFTEQDNERLFEKVIRKCATWGTKDQLMFVVGATKADMLADIRAIAPDHFLLVPGVGAQGGSLSEVAKYGMNKECGLLVNMSRGLIYVDASKDFAKASKAKAVEVSGQMQLELEKAQLI